ncbi:hypothetical protein GGR21_002049 [Dysgonomonas hofstadii]|uniref:Uncharacterized protein n=1 Tax=Dysgonomonas hofstadii TaxID=637886 RepID=A0A840CPY9_9BACT|nr:hypothetical protein [Dysgonomonas hofstadii]MBB4036148.1 hypothetical protein [Dysgonomonas hofstadii]
MKKHITNIATALIVVLFFMSSCSGGATYSIDNPTDQAISVSIDGKDAISIGAKEYKKMDGTLSKGEHTMKVGDGQEVKFNLDQDHVMLNPTLSTYVRVLQEYGVGMQSTANDTIINIDGQTYEGPFPLVSNEPVLYTGDLNFQVDAPFKDEITTSKTGTVTMKKLFRKDEFLKFYKDEYE